MKKILLNTVNRKSPNYKKYSALIDNEDYERVSKYNWSVEIEPNTIYVHSCINGKRTYLHNFIMGFKGIDHIDGNGLNNQKSNLRKATNQQNQMNRKSGKNSSSKFKGVFWHKTHRKWMVQIVYNRRSIYLGLFTCEREAAKVYNEYAIKYYGEFARLNKLGFVKKL